MAWPCTEAGLNPKKPLENLSPTRILLTPPPGLPNTKIDSLFHHLSIYIKDTDTSLYIKGYASKAAESEEKKPAPILAPLSLPTGGAASLLCC